MAFGVNPNRLRQVPTSMIWEQFTCECEEDELGGYYNLL
jgi:hypothetical protein